MSICVLGANGMLGSDLVALLHRSGRPFTTADLPAVDITVPAQVEAATRDAAVIVNCAAYTNVDGAESAAATAMAVNAEAVGRLGELAAARGQRVIHVSTDFVYDGCLARPYTEADPPHPINVYGASKLAGEERLGASGCRHAIVRIEWTYGRHGRHFVGKIAELARTRPLLRVVDDQVGSPTPTTDVAAVLLALVDSGAEGLYLYATEGYATRCEIARAIVAHYGLTTAVEPCATADFPAAAARPLNSRFDCTKIVRAIAPPRRHWQDALTAYLEQNP